MLLVAKDFSIRLGFLDQNPLGSYAQKPYKHDPTSLKWSDLTSKNNYLSTITDLKAHHRTTRYT